MRSCNNSVPKIGIAIVQWNHVDHTLRLLSDLIENSELKIALCDNGSDPENWQHLKEWLTLHFSQPANNANDSKWRLKLHRNAYNSGFAAGANVCIRTLLDVDCEWLWILNNDTRIEKSQLVNLFKSLKSRPAGVYGTSICDQQDSTQLGASAYNKWTTARRPLKHSNLIATNHGDSWYLDGASIIIHKTVIEKIGLFSEATFLYFEELDFGKRLSKSTEFSSDIIQDIVVQHLGAGSSNNIDFKRKRMYHETWSTLSFYKRHYPTLYYLVLFGRTPVRIAMLCLKRRWKEIKPVFEGTVDFMKGFNREKINAHIIESHTYL